MPQLHLLMFPTGVTHMTSELAFEKKDGGITYFNGHMPVFTDDEKDVVIFRMITTSCASGSAEQSNIIRTFGVTSIKAKAAERGAPRLSMATSRCSAAFSRRCWFLCISS